MTHEFQAKYSFETLKNSIICVYWQLYCWYTYFDVDSGYDSFQVQQNQRNQHIKKTISKVLVLILLLLREQFNKFSSLTAHSCLGWQFKLSPQ